MTHPPAARLTISLQSISMGFIAFVVGALSDVWLLQHGSNLLVAVMDDALVGLGVGLLVFLYELRERRSMFARLRVIGLMNHHVRNSLQVISCAVSIAERQEHTKRIEEAVTRIEWALREVLPAQPEDAEG